MNVKLNIYRHNPEHSDESRRQIYDVEVQPTDRVLDALMYISRNIDGTLAFRKSCAHGVCGSDAMRICGKERLACKTLIREVAEKDGDTISIDPLNNMKIQKDLMVDQSEFLMKFRSVEPFLKPRQAPPDSSEYIQSAEARKLIDEATKCINCGACYSACPVLAAKPNFIGPAALVSAARFVFDSRDKGFPERLKILNHPDTVWSCENHFNCSRVCPRGIKVTKLINLMKRVIRNEFGDRP